MFFVVRSFDQSVVIHFGRCDLVFECSIIVVIIFNVDDIANFDNSFNNCCILIKFYFLRL